MEVVIPLDLYGTSRVTSSTVAEPDTTIPETVWTSGATFALNDNVIETTNHRTYQSLQAANTNNALPNYANGETVNDWWIDVGPDNKYAMFDNLRNTQTIAQDTITVVLTPGQRVNAIALMDLIGQEVVVSATSVQGGGTVYGPKTISIRSRNTVDWLSYFFGVFTAVPSVLLTDIPLYSDIIITIEINNSGGTVACGACCIGTSQYIGNIEYNPVSDATNYSDVDRDEFGNVTLVPRRSVPKTTQTVYADATLVNQIRALRTNLNAVPAIWSGLDTTDANYINFGEALLILGFYRTFTITMIADDIVQLDLEIEEL